MEKKKSKMAEDTLGMEPAVHRKELEKRIDRLEKLTSILTDIVDEIEKIEKKMDQICTRMGISKLE